MDAPSVWEMHHCKAEELLASLPDNSIDLILTDPPYFRVKNEPWDRQWDKPTAFLAWLGDILDGYKRVLKPNGSLYVFASPKMAGRVELKVWEHFNVLNRLTWRKPPFSTKAEMFSKGDLRTFFPASEAIIFAEHYGADNMAKGEAGYEAKCDELRGFVFEPLRAYLDGERIAAGISKQQVDAAWCIFKSVSQTAQSQKWFTSSCWNLPTSESYHWLRGLFGGDFLSHPYESLREQYESLRQQYETIRRPFQVTADVPYTDVWDFPTVAHYPGKHPCEKPRAMLEHIIQASSREGATVLDTFAGSGATGAAALNLNRKFIGCDASEHWAGYATKRLIKFQPVNAPQETKKSRAATEQMRLF